MNAETRFASVTIVDLLRAEMLKYKGTLLLRLAIFAPLIIVVIYFGAGLSKGTEFLPPESDVWHVYSLRIMSAGFGFFYPLHLILLGALICQIDHQNVAWKHLLVQPVAKSSHFWVKWTGFLLLTLASVVVFLAAIFSSGIVLGWIHPEIGLGMPHNVSRVAWVALSGWVGSLAVLSIQYVISMRWKNIAIPLSVGIAGFVATNLLAQGWEYAVYSPYIYPTLSVSPLLMDRSLWFVDQQALGLAVGAAAVLAGWWDFIRRDVD